MPAVIPQRQTSRSASMRPPVAGWDAWSSIEDMPEDRAVIMDNWFPEVDEVRLRQGYASHATGMSGNVESLITYTGVDGADEMFAANGGSIYDVSSSGAVGAAVVSGMTNDRWQYINMGTSGGQFLLAFNGADTPRTYNGSTWSTFGGTGPTVASLIGGALHQRRLWLWESDSLSVWYGGVNSITGSFTEFPLYGIFQKGGYVMAAHSWTRDSGAGQDDVMIFLSSEGECAVYSGTDPSSASTWGLVGVFQIGKPVGRRCITKYGADVAMLTEDGIVSASAILAQDRASALKVAISAQVNRAFADEVRDHKTLFGWQPLIYPQGQMAMFNIPQSTTVSYQYVFNTVSGAPCRFTGVNAVCWGLLSDDAYFGGTDGVVYKFDTGTSDNGAAIVGDCVPAFSYFGSKGAIKRFNLVEPIFTGSYDPTPALDLNVDFQVVSPTGLTTPSPTASGLWGVGKWGVATWGSPSQTWRGWRGVRGKGRAASLRVRVSTTTARPSWVATNFIYTTGGPV